MGQTLHFTGRQREAKGYLEKVIDVQSKSGDEHVISFLYNQRVAARSILARTLCVLGLVDQAKHMARINFEEAQARDDKLSVCYTLARAGGRVALLAGDFAAAERAIAILSDLSADLGMPFWRQLADCLNGELLIRRGEVAKGSILLRAALDVMLMDRRALHHVGFLYPLAEGLGSAGRVSEGLATIEDALAHSERDGERWCEAELHRVKGELLALKESGRFSAAAEACLLRAIDVAREHGALFWELRATLSLARLWVEHGRRDGAHQLLAAVYNRFTEGFDTPDLCSAKAFLASL
jgi:predicted ATPase